MGSSIASSFVNEPRDFRAERLVDLSWRPFRWQAMNFKEQREFKLNRLIKATKVAFENGNAEVASDLLKTYVVPVADYQNNAKGRYAVNYNGMEIDGLWNRNGAGDGKGYNQFTAQLSWRGIMKEKALFNSEYARNDANNLDRTILSFMSNGYSSNIKDEELIKRKYKENKFEERIAYNLIQLSAALATGDAKFEFKPY